MGTTIYPQGYTRAEAIASELGRKPLASEGDWLIIDTRDGEPIAVHVIASVQNGEWGIKLVDESMGPYDLAIPKRLFDMLDPASDFGGYSREWRQKVKDAIAHNALRRGPHTALKRGDKVEFDAWPGRKYVFEGGTIFARDDGGHRIRMYRAWKRHEFWRKVD